MSRGPIAFLFPGQASQRVGMGKDLVERYPEAASCFEQARELLDFDLPKLCFEGPLERLTETRNAQPAILLHSLAVAAVLRASGAIDPAYVAGHSLGEFSAAAAVGAMELSDAIRVVRRRGELMWGAGVEVPGTMAAVMGLAPDRIEEVCRKLNAEGKEQVVLANLNSPAQSVISGHVRAVRAAEGPLKAAGARRVMPLNVSGAFHSPLMEVVREEFITFLRGVPLRDPGCPVISNVSARPVDQVDALREGFSSQLVSPVRWHDCVQWMVQQGVELFVEVGPGNVLGTLGARSFPTAQFVSTSDVEGLEKVLATASGRG